MKITAPSSAINKPKSIARLFAEYSAVPGVAHVMPNQQNSVNIRPTVNIHPPTSTKAQYKIIIGLSLCCQFM